MEEEDELNSGSLFATGLIAGGALAGVIIALLSVNEGIYNGLQKVNAEQGLTHMIGTGGYYLLGLAFFAAMGWMLYRNGIAKED